MHSKIAGLAFLLLATTAIPTVAAPSGEDAAKIQAALDAYFGKQFNLVKVEPDGEIYKATVDFSTLIGTAKDSGVELTMPPLEFSLAPEGEGKWRVKRDGDFEFSGKMADKFNFKQTMTEFAVDAEFDEQLGTFTSSTGSVKTIDLKEEITDAQSGPASVDMHVEDVSAESTVSANEAGGFDAKITEETGATVVKESAKISGGEPVAAELTAEKASAEYNLTGTKFKELMAFINFMGKHSDKDALLKDQAVYKILLQAMLPGFLNMTGTGSLNKIQIVTPVGNVNMDKLSYGLDMNGAVKDGKVKESLGIEGLKIPAGLAPPYASGMVPKNFNMDFTVSGFDPGTALTSVIAAMDLSKEPVIPKEMEAQLLTQLLPTGKVDINLGKSVLSNELYTITVDSTMSAGPAAMPSGKAHVTIKGMDEIMKAVQAAPPEANLQQGSALIIVAKGLAKTESDGSLSWDVESTADGKVLVNGTDVNKLK